VADELLARLSEPVKGSPDGRPKRYYTKYDATAAFHQVKLSENAQTCMAFHAGNRLMTWNVMSFGHKNCVQMWQRIMDDALRGLPYAMAFADDIIVYSDTFEEHVQHVATVLQRLRAIGV
jgi:hypothetical protein